MSYAIREYSPADERAVIALWHARGLTRPWNDPREDVARAHRAFPELLLVAEDGGEVVGTVLGGDDGHRGWIYYLASAAERSGEGIGRALIAEVEHRLRKRGCPKVQLMVRAENHGVTAYYEALGYADASVTVLGKRLDA
ncbi:putative acetyltransferase [Leucobacter sp. 7(1)]|uniref:GNAT family acetyltransferase n=1 Tax=Leucobacter sp. 7(1) TaxID=1255613 RepID=UPI00097E7BFA|nr:putative acetyltransferase [Leucobacter sp. 7(1)]